MHKKTFFLSFGTLALSLFTMFLVFSCKNSSRTTDQDVADADSLNKALLATDIKEVLYPLPAPFEMTQMLTDIGASYASKNLNAPSKIEKYVTEPQKAVNLGVYGADLAYASTYQQQQDIQTYLNAIKTLADDLGVNYDYARLLSDDFKSKLENKDSLISIVTNTIYDTYQYLDQESNPDLAVNMVAGMWIELMYIATNISENSYNFTGMVDIISKQKTSFEKVLSLLTERNANADLKALETKLRVLKPVYEKVDAGLSEADYNLILKTIRSVRNSII